MFEPRVFEGRACVAPVGAAEAAHVFDRAAVLSRRFSCRSRKAANVLAKILNISYDSLEHIWDYLEKNYQSPQKVRDWRA